MIGKKRPNNEIIKKLNQIKALGYDRIAQEHEKQIMMTIQKGGALYHIDKAITADLKEAIKAKYPNRNINK